MSRMESEAVPNKHDTCHRKSPKVGPLPDRQIIQLKERNMVMLKQDLILRNPMRLLGHEDDTIITGGQLGAVLARTGVGKTALIVQIALNSMLRSRNVLHISLNEPVGKVDLWYQEVLGRLAATYQVANMDHLWDTIVPHRFIMTFQVEGFSGPKLEERLTDLTSQNIFHPHMILIDGLPFDQHVQPALEELKALAEKLVLPMWFTITTHRHEAPAPDGLPIQFSPVQDLFDAAIALQPEADVIHIKALKGRRLTEAGSSLVLDPATMLIRGQE